MAQLQLLRPKKAVKKINLHIYFSQATVSISVWAVLYNSSLLARFKRRCIIAGSSSSNLPNCFPCKKKTIWIVITPYYFNNATECVLKMRAPNKTLTSFFPKSVKKWSSKLRLASRTWQYTTDFGMEFLKLPTTIWTYDRTFDPVHEVIWNGK